MYNKFELVLLSKQLILLAFCTTFQKIELTTLGCLLGVFSLEKMCISEKQFQEDFPDEEALRLGCFEMFDGMIKYCVCTEDLCNQKSLSLQMRNDPNYKRY